MDVQDASFDYTKILTHNRSYIRIMKANEMHYFSNLTISQISVGERPAAARLLRSWVRIPPGAWIFVCCECSVLSGRGLCDELITHPGESYDCAASSCVF